ncbi:hypothetical protein Mal52_07740 [Symmachiella dynata]|uniref:Uncharacterized protein n=1 Tax=Symmachiella dynata TaxID=2527995 RepID=A0A517ZIL8_9PLAN|nr:hypothetical protein [Symmachiella dynata]QDU42318.1 hypothetical protein Mal52_07740 [Symmachiella dynata]
MWNVKATKAALALVIGSTTLFALTTFAADSAGQPSNHFRVRVTDVIAVDDSVVKQMQIEAKPGCKAEITSDKKGGGGLWTTAGKVEDKGLGLITVTILVDRVEWKAGEVNALKFLMAIDGNNSKALMSDSGPMSAGKQLNELLSVAMKSGEYEYGKTVPLLKFKDKTYSLTVTAPPASPR